eukprot:CAMPEP_0194269662 /NCGR_PEP_ID=MMETSP0169-20130528/3791_1 /TAXON_ID=218684 /ORGANISM="Corethron pennatum, Strain L29A3" /LENGTH=540 /DNA_ID=CAMNT_0039011395 /DNA_START=226 /DNA_END=1848 /DNA_ORIENTATION=+
MEEKVVGIARDLKYLQQWVIIHRQLKIKFLEKRLQSLQLELNQTGEGRQEVSPALLRLKKRLRCKKEAMLDLIKTSIDQSEWLNDNSTTIIKSTIRGDENHESVYEQEALVNDIKRYVESFKKPRPNHDNYDLYRNKMGQQEVEISTKNKLEFENEAYTCMGHLKLGIECESKKEEEKVRFKKEAVVGQIKTYMDQFQCMDDSSRAFLESELQGKPMPDCLDTALDTCQIKTCIPSYIQNIYEFELELLGLRKELDLSKNSYDETKNIARSFESNDDCKERLKKEHQAYPMSRKNGLDKISHLKNVKGEGLDTQNISTFSEICEFQKELEPSENGSNGTKNIARSFESNEKYKERLKKELRAYIMAEKNDMDLISYLKNVEGEGLDSKQAAKVLRHMCKVNTSILNQLKQIEKHDREVSSKIRESPRGSTCGGRFSETPVSDEEGVEMILNFRNKHEEILSQIKNVTVMKRKADLNKTISKGGRYEDTRQPSPIREISETRELGKEKDPTGMSEMQRRKSAKNDGIEFKFGNFKFRIEGL